MKFNIVLIKVEQPTILIRDFNAHHPNWNPNINFSKMGKNAYEFINEKNNSDDAPRPDNKDRS